MISGLTFESGINIYNSVSGYNITLLNNCTFDFLNISSDGNIYFSNQINECHFKNLNTTGNSTISIINTPSTLIVSSSGSYTFHSSDSSEINLSPEENITVYGNSDNFQVNYTFSYNTADQNGYIQGTEDITEGITGMTINFFGLIPTLGMIFGVILIISGLVIVVFYAIKLSRSDNNFNG